MTYFEELCNTLGASPDSEMGAVISEMVNKLIFAERRYSWEEISSIVIEQFNKKYH